MEDSIIIVEGLHKDFKLPHQKAGALKNIFTNVFSLGNSGYEVQHALKDISFDIKRGDFFGIVGRNGSGKSTLLKILAGIYQPTKGSVQVGGRVVPFIELGVGFNGELTGRENVFLNGALLGFSEKEIEAKYQDIVDFAELERFMDQKLKNYSSGMQVRLAFSVATRLAESDILLIDEVLAVGDADFQRKCFNYFRDLKKQKKTVVFVSHDMNAIREYCDKVVLIEKNKLVTMGDPNMVATAYTRMFMDRDQDIGKEANKSKRWGDKATRYKSIEVLPKKISDGVETITLKLEAVANEDIDNLNFGFSIKNTANTPLLGTNTKLKKQNIKHLKKGEKIKLEWTVPNVFGDGEYFLDVTTVREDSSPTDWWEDAASFYVYKEERTPYILTPNCTVRMDYED